MQRPDPTLFYTQPMFRAASPDFAQAKEQTDWGLETPGARFMLAFDLYRFEAFATRRDRDVRCGQTGHEDVRYAPATFKDVTQNKVTLDQIACGHDIDHPSFDAVVSPLLRAAVRRLVGEIMNDPDRSEKTIASAEIIIARARYSIEAKSVGDRIEFLISAISVFEERDEDAMDRTICWLEHRLKLMASPALFGASPN